MNKKIILLLLLIIVVGCAKQNENNSQNNENNNENTENTEIIDEPVEDVVVYKDDNNTPIGIYRSKNRISEFKKSITVGKDIALLNIFPSNDSVLSYDTFGQTFYDTWNSYKKDSNLKIGFNLKYSTTDNGDISHTILNYSDTDDYEGYILIFLYDDYDIYKNKRVYSHIEAKNDNENTLYSSIKLYPQSAYPNINSKIILTVFTYDGLDDFDEDGEYRGNSKYSLIICDTNKTC